MGKFRIAFLCTALAMAAVTTAYILENTCPMAAPVAAVSIETSLSTFRTDRDAMRAMEKAQLNDIIHSDGAAEEVRTDAQRRLMELMERQETETLLEGLLAVRGFRGALVTVNGDCINALIDTPMVTAQESSAILDIICSQTDVKVGNVKIIPAE